MIPEEIRIFEHEKFINLNSLELSPRARRCLGSANIKTFKQLYNISNKDLLSIKGFGRRTLKEVREEAIHFLAREICVMHDNMQHLAKVIADIDGFYFGKITSDNLKKE